MRLFDPFGKKDFKKLNQIKTKLKNKYADADFEKSTVKIILDDNNLKTWLFITEKDFWFILDSGKLIKVYRTPRQGFKYTIEDFIQSQEFGRLFVDKIEFPIVFDKVQFVYSEKP